MDETVPPDLAPLWEDLNQEMAWLHAKWIMYRQLFAATERRIALLNASASVFFRVIHDTLLDDVVLTICKLTDDRGTGARRNAVLDELLHVETIRSRPEVLVTLTAQLTAVKNSTAPLRFVRNKRIAHRDFDTALASDEDLPGVSRTSVEDALRPMREAMNTAHSCFSHSELSYQVFMSADGNALVETLKRGLVFEQLEAQGTIAWDCLPHSEWGDA